MKIDCTKSHLKQIGQKIRNNVPLDIEDIRSLSEFRMGHEKILADFRYLFNSKINNKNSLEILFAQRLKKRDTIYNKLKRHSEMDITRMHDIAGARLIFNSISELRNFRAHILKKPLKKYRKIYQDDKYDYIANPRETGYRGVHDVYEEIGADSIKAKIEIQYRTTVQHSWATMLETWDSYYGRESKFENEHEEIQKLFQYISEMFWRTLEGENGESHKIILSNMDLYKNILQLDNKHNVLSRLNEIKVLKADYADGDGKRHTGYMLLQKFRNQMDEQSAKLIIDLLCNRIIENEFEEYFLGESKDDQSDLVMVTIEHKHLKRAYNNYFNDVGAFLRNYKRATKKLWESLTKWERLKMRFMRNTGLN